MERYEPQRIEEKWQRVWAEARAFNVPERLDGGRKTYVLEMLPYPSGELHMGHVRNYMLGEVVAHFRRRHGAQVLRPMGFDSFGLPAENAAIRAGGNPRDVTPRNIASIRAAMERLGWAIDWDRVLATHEPEYYRWTQWLFLRFFEHGLAYREERAGQVVSARPDGARERAGGRRTLRALRRSRRVEEPRAMAVSHHRLRGPVARRDGAARVVARPCADDAAQLDRPLGRRRSRLPYRRPRRRPARVHHAPRHAVRRDVLRTCARASTDPRARRRDRARAGGARLREPRSGPLDGRPRGEGEGRRLHGALRGQPGERRAHPRLGRGLRPRRVRHGRDHGRPCARPAGSRVRGAVRAAGRRGRRRRRAARRLGAVLRAPRGRRQARDRRVARRARPRQGDGQLPAARLAALAAALLGRADPDRLLRRLRDRAGAGRGPPRAAAADRRLPAEGPIAARRGRGLGADNVPVVRRRGAPRDRHDGHVRRLVLVLPALLRPGRTTPRRSIASSSTTGCRSTSTSAASSTRSCTCSTRASSSR